MPASTEFYDVVVLGAGAAGLMCAITAAQRGRRVLVVEKANKPGKKILMSGGGRCNFTNLVVEPENFISGNPHFPKSALTRYTQWDFIALVERHGIEYEQRKHGQLFCLHSAKEILAMLLAECATAGVEVRTGWELSAVQPHAALVRGRTTAYELELAVSTGQHMQQRALFCESLVVATGALSIPTLGGSGIGYTLAQQFKLPLTERRAGLVPFMFSDAMKPVCERLAGVSLPVHISCNGQAFGEQLLFTHRGISGPVVLQISNYWRPGDDIVVNLLPDIEALAWLQQMKQQQARMRLKNLLRQALPRALVSELQALWWPELEASTMAQLGDGQLRRVATQLACWTLRPAGTEGYRTAEVTLGGVATDGISSKTFEARGQPGLFFIGEVLDVTGHLGGFNFQWAWSSGYAAGLHV